MSCGSWFALEHISQHLNSALAYTQMSNQLCLKNIPRLCIEAEIFSVETVSNDEISITQRDKAADFKEIWVKNAKYILEYERISCEDKKSNYFQRPKSHLNSSVRDSWLQISQTWLKEMYAPRQALTIFPTSLKIMLVFLKPQKEQTGFAVVSRVLKNKSSERKLLLTQQDALETRLRHLYWLCWGLAQEAKIEKINPISRKNKIRPGRYAI